MTAAPARPTPVTPIAQEKGKREGEEGSKMKEREKERRRGKERERGKERRGWRERKQVHS